MSWSKWMAVAVVAAGLAVGVAAVAGAFGGGEQRVTGAAAQKAKAAAVEFVGGGQAIEVERGDDDEAYEVEVRKPSGEEVEVRLDERFQSLGSEQDEDEENDGDER